MTYVRTTVNGLISVKIFIRFPTFRARGNTFPIGWFPCRRRRQLAGRVSLAYAPLQRPPSLSHVRRQWITSKHLSPYRFHSVNDTCDGSKWYRSWAIGAASSMVNFVSLWKGWKAFDIKFCVYKSYYIYNISWLCQSSGEDWFRIISSFFFFFLWRDWCSNTKFIIDFARE